MSRTFRKRISKPYIFSWLERQEWWMVDWIKREKKNNKKFVQQEIAKHTTDVGTKNIMSEPGPAWFRRMYMTKPMRRKTKALCHKVKTLESYEDAPEFPHQKKPKEYYW